VQAIAAALNEQAWDGAWYLRDFYDDRSRLGSALSNAFQIDSIDSAWQRLFIEREQMLLLFTPPFNQQTAADPGYVKGYPPGVRENGGQYAHVAAWAVWPMPNQATEIGPVVFSIC
jgi:cyclic beta-1,2-glucan synthetase